MKANINFVLPRLATGGDLHHKNEDGALQLADLIDQGVTHIVDCRIEANDEEFVAGLDPDTGYLHIGVDDDGGCMPHDWYDAGTGWVLDVLDADPDHVVFVHCHMGINRGPSLTYAAMLAMGYDPVAAIELIRNARPVAAVGYAEDALEWFHVSRDIAADERRAERDALGAWRAENPHDTLRIIRRIRRGDDPMAA
jgi:dual specificity phosphatase 3